MQARHVALAVCSLTCCGGPADSFSSAFAFILLLVRPQYSLYVAGNALLISRQYALRVEHQGRSSIKAEHRSRRSSIKADHRSRQSIKSDHRGRSSRQIFRADHQGRSSGQIFRADHQGRSSRQIIKADYQGRSSGQRADADRSSRQSIKAEHQGRSLHDSRHTPQGCQVRGERLAQLLLIQRSERALHLSEISAHAFVLHGSNCAMPTLRHVRLVPQRGVDHLLHNKEMRSWPLQLELCSGLRTLGLMLFPLAAGAAGAACS
jgi:hypothetical protein